MYSIEVLTVVTKKSTLHVAGFLDLPLKIKKTDLSLRFVLGNFKDMAKISNATLARSLFAHIFSAPLLKATV